jgi:2-oxoglutarate dioxygenase / 2-oxoglutarate/L-arginine monooxygenase/decarboxylase
MTQLRSFRLPSSIDGTRVDVEMGKQMILAWRLDRRFQVELPAAQARRLATASVTAQRFFALGAVRKARCAGDLSYSGYVARGGRLVDGRPDDAERFTACKDLPASDPRVEARWPCHGPVPWPDTGLAGAVAAVATDLGGVGARLLRLLALGLQIQDVDTLVRLTSDGWHHLTAVHVPAGRSAAGQAGGESGCGMLVLAVGDDPRRVTVSAGDSMQFLTGGYLPSTAAQVPAGGLVYFHEPNFQTTLRPLPGTEQQPPSMHYGSHFTSSFMRRHPDHPATARILAESRLAVLGHFGGLRLVA